MADQMQAVYPLRILVEIDNDSPTMLRELQDIVDEQLGQDAASNSWQVQRFFERGDEISGPAGYYEVRGLIPVFGSTSVRELSFEAAARLGSGLDESAAGIAVPDLPSSSFGGESMEHLPSSDLAPESGAVSWPIAAMRCLEAWNLPASSKGGGVTIGHPDTGYTFHTEIVGALDLQRDVDVIANDLDAEDPMEDRWWWPDQPGHGTSTGSVIVGSEGGDVTGSAPEATLIPIRTIKSVVQVSDGDVAQAIDKAVSAGAHIISMSLGGVGFYGGIRAAIRTARAAGVIVMAAAGNQVRIVVAPARFEECIAVAATGPDGRPWSGSSRGGAVAICAPGHQVPVARAEEGLSQTSPGSSLGLASGTSYAVAHLAGIAALWLAFHGRDNLLDKYGGEGVQQAFEQILASHEPPPNWDTSRWGAGIVDAVKVLKAPLPDLALVPESAPAEESATDRLLALMPDHADAPAEMCELLGCSASELEPLARVHGPEIAFLLGERQPALAEGAELSPESAAGASRLRALIGEAAISPTLRNRIG